jgi:hypothetical protein
MKSQDSRCTSDNKIFNNTGFTHLQIEQSPSLGGYHPQIPILSVPSTEFVEPPPPQTKFLGTPLLGQVECMLLVLTVPLLSPPWLAMFQLISHYYKKGLIDMILD